MTFAVKLKCFLQRNFYNNSTVSWPRISHKARWVENEAIIQFRGIITRSFLNLDGGRKIPKNELKIYKTCEILITAHRWIASRVGLLVVSTLAAMLENFGISLRHDCLLQCYSSFLGLKVPRWTQSQFMCSIKWWDPLLLNWRVLVRF